MKERSIFSYWWFWLLIIGIFLILLAAVLHLAFKENTKWVWWIFAGGALLAILGIIFAFVSYSNEPKCVPTPVSEETGCPDIVQSSTPKMETNKIVSPVYSPIGQPSMSTLNLPQAQRGFSSSATDISALAPSP